jgi:hypothetical protein
VKGAFEVILARHRVAKSRLVAVQLVQDHDPTTTVAQIRRNGHRSFPELLDHIADGTQQFLVWEPWEASLADVLASDCDVTDREIAEIIWPVRIHHRGKHPLTVPDSPSQVLSGIAFLRKQGLALVRLTESHILLMARGSVKIGNNHWLSESPLKRPDLTPWQQVPNDVSRSPRRIETPRAGS